jgi:hypothetical protein
MTLRSRSTLHAMLVACTAVVLGSLQASDAQACGGCFHPENNPEATVVTGHRMAFAVSPTQTVLWDQIKYSGNPAEFAWVLPIKPGAYVEVANNAWFETLDAATTEEVVAPTLQCFSSLGNSNRGCGFGCGAASFASAEDGSANNQKDVTIVHEGTVGPYETVTLHSTTKGALTKWLSDHAFAIDTDIAPVVDAYEQEGFDFIALRLQPGKDVQSMQPVRVVSPGATPALPLRMVAAGTGANVAITLFVIGEGRWQTKNFADQIVDMTKLSWDFSTNASNYSQLRVDALAQNGGSTFITTYAQKGAFFSPLDNPVQPGSQISYAPSGQIGFGNVATTIAQAYVYQGIADNQAYDNYACGDRLKNFAGESRLVAACSPAQGGGGGGAGGGAGGHGGSGGSGGSGGGVGAGGAGGGQPCQVGPNEIDRSELVCGTLDDVAVAVTGMHPRDVWLTRLEANLPRAALATDLQLTADSTQSIVPNWVLAPKDNSLNAPCTDPKPVSGALATPPKPMNPRSLDGLIVTGIAAAIGLSIARRSARPRVARARR